MSARPVNLSSSRRRTNDGDPAPRKTAARPVFLVANRYNTPRRHPTGTHAREHDDSGSCSSRRRSHLLFASCPRETFTLFRGGFCSSSPRTYVDATHPGTRFMNSTTVFFFARLIFRPVGDGRYDGAHVGLPVNDPTVCAVSVNLLIFCFNFLKITENKIYTEKHCINTNH